MFSFVKKGAGLFMLVCGLAGIVIVNVISAKAKDKSPTSTIISTVALTAVSTTDDITTQLTVSTSGECYIDIKGEVKIPGVYVVTSGTRIFQVIEMAGGVTLNGSTASLNLAEVVTDGMVVYVPSLQTDVDTNISSLCVQIRGEVVKPGIYYLSEGETVADLVDAAGGVTTEADITDLDFERLLTQGFSLVVPSYSQSQENTEEEETDTINGLININTADLETLMTLNGIGIILGQRIIDYRAENGDFVCCEDVMLVSGIKEAIYEDIKDFITVGNG